MLLPSRKAPQLRPLPSHVPVLHRPPRLPHPSRAASKPLPRPLCATREPPNSPAAHRAQRCPPFPSSPVWPRGRVDHGSLPGGQVCLACVPDAQRAAGRDEASLATATAAMSACAVRVCPAPPPPQSPSDSAWKSPLLW
uniref:Uncharacterized protein n=1 Tax=Setaria viridis TaxID=4556 RepID=A0A4U6U368_SETVI|nr:hypothetical protein SEVIR_6G042000v2 [Setaria viridis]TKW08714.1 hypothetical protein SEVIR_6G042000v2 [Setaria viridis]TKW08715.1 hypothetical protein SEVIR_6G042000v2 [Setaria viridis]